MAGQPGRHRFAPRAAGERGDGQLVVGSVGSTGNPVERRRFPRLPVAVPCRLGDGPGLFWTENLSVGGALLVPAGPVAPGSRVDVELQFSWSDPINVKARVVYHRDAELPEYPATGLRFQHTEKGTRAAVRRALDAMPVPSAAADAPAVLVMAESTPLRRALEADIGQLGVRSLGLDRPLDAIWRLIAGDLRVTSVLVELSTLRDPSLELFHFLEDEFPSVTRVVVYEPPLPPRAQQLLEEQHAHALLPVPWSDRMLAELMRLRPKRH